MDERIEAVQRMQDYIESNLEQDISMADLSKAAGYSPWYSYRLFHRCMTEKRLPWAGKPFCSIGCNKIKTALRNAVPLKCRGN